MSVWPKLSLLCKKIIILQKNDLKPEIPRYKKIRDTKEKCKSNSMYRLLTLRSRYLISLKPIKKYIFQARKL